MSGPSSRGILSTGSPHCGENENKRTPKAIATEDFNNLHCHLSSHKLLQPESLRHPHSYCWRWSQMKKQNEDNTTASTQNQSHHTLPNKHTKIQLQVKVFLYKIHSRKFRRGKYSTRRTDINAGTQETWKMKKIWHHQRNTLTFW